MILPSRTPAPWYRVRCRADARADVIIRGDLHFQAEDPADAGSVHWSVCPASPVQGDSPYISRYRPLQKTNSRFLVEYDDSKR
jgi:hypothetical protein